MNNSNVLIQSLINQDIKSEMRYQSYYNKMDYYKMNGELMNEKMNCMSEYILCEQ